MVLKVVKKNTLGCYIGDRFWIGIYSCYV